MSKINHSSRKPVKMDITPLIDCVFLLIVFFVVAGKFKKVESKLNAYMPKKIGINPDSKPDPDKFFIPIICTHDASANRLSWRVNDKEIDSRDDLVREINMIKDSCGADKNVKVTIDSEPQVDFFWIIACVDACAEADLTEIIFAPPRVPLSGWPHPTPDYIKKASGRVAN